MRRALFIFIGGMLFGVAAHAIPYRLKRERNVTTGQINGFFQIAVDRGVWPGLASDVDELCGYRTDTGGAVRVRGRRSGSDALMDQDRIAQGDSISVD